MNEPPLNDAQLRIQQQLALVRAMERALAERAEMLREARDYLSDAGDRRARIANSSRARR